MMIFVKLMYSIVL